MSTAIHSGKAKPGQRARLPSTGPLATRERKTPDAHSDKKTSANQPTPFGKIPAEKTDQTITRPIVKASAGARILEGAHLLAMAMRSYAAQLHRGTEEKAGRHTSTFLEAYSFLISAVPKKNRLDLLMQMRRGIDEVARTELNVTLGESAANDEAGRVGTADFMAGLEQQEQEQREKDISSERLLPGAAMRARLQVSPQALSAALKAKRMFVMQGPSGEYVYPAFFADSAYDRRVLEKVSKALGDLPGAAKWDFFMSPRVSLAGKTPLNALAKGKVDEVMAAADAFREQ